jgi:hypothetical protein
VTVVFAGVLAIGAFAVALLPREGSADAGA